MHRPEGEAWYAQTRDSLERAYLEAEDPRGQSGFRGDEARWERGRRPVVSAVDRDGTFLDVGCANGLLMESVVEWAGEDGYRIEPYGLDLIESLADLARRRLPRWSDRISVGNVMNWQPPMKFDLVHTNLEYVPPPVRPEMVERILRQYLVSGGRLILSSYGSSRRPFPRAEAVDELLGNWGHEVSGETGGKDLNGKTITRVAWTDRPAARSADRLKC